MGLRRWVRHRWERFEAGSPPQVDLIEPQNFKIKPPASAGLPHLSIGQPWSVARLAALFREAEHQPSATSIQAARIARHRLSCFWLSAPVDHLEALYGSSIGRLQRSMLAGPLIEQALASDERDWMHHIHTLFLAPNEQARQWATALALMPYAKPGQLVLTEHPDAIPDWLLPDYIKYIAPEWEGSSKRPAGLLQPVVADNSFEPMTERRGESAMAWFRDQAVLDHISALIEQYRQDSQNVDPIEELAGVRVVLGQLWLDVEPCQFQTLLQTAVGDVTLALIRSGFGQCLVDDQDHLIRQQLAERAKNLAAPDAPGVLLATLMFHSHGQVALTSVEELPEWFVEVLRDL